MKELNSRNQKTQSQLITCTKSKKPHRCDHLEYTINKAQQSLHANPCDIFYKNKYNTTKSCNNQNHDELTYKHQRNKTIQQQGMSVSNAATHCIADTHHEEE